MRNVSLSAISILCSAGTLHGFTGPINQQDGTVFLAEGEVATRLQLDTMMFYVEGITATAPN